MTRDELLAIVKQSRADTLIAFRMRQALCLPMLVTDSVKAMTRDCSAKSRKYRGARKLMKQKHGVRL